MPLLLPDQDPRSRASLRARKEALGHFQFWTNVLVVTAGVAVAWVAEGKPALDAWAAITATWLLALSAAFGILTLALVPPLRESLDWTTQSIYEVRVRVTPLHASWSTIDPKLGWFCLPQHLAFILGLGVYAAGATAIRV
jgi:hypothetical protein